MDRENIIKENPSICYGCDKARRPASEENLKLGYVGCCLRAMEPSKDYYVITDGDEVAEGWVDLKSRVFDGKSGIITNLQLLTKGIKSCLEYEVLNKGR